jgi:DNA-binding CsgD family transcriptional regulator
VKLALEDVNELIGEVYDAAIQPALWPTTLERLGQLLGGAALVMSALHRSEGMLLGVVTGQDKDLSGILRTRYNNPRTNPLVAAMPMLPVGVLVSRQAVHADKVYLKSDLYNEIFRPQELTHRAVACLHRSEDLICPLGVLRPLPAPGFSAEELRILALLLPHLRRGLRLSLRLVAQQDRAAKAAEALNRLALGVLVAGQGAKIVHLNHGAEGIFLTHDGLWLQSGELIAWQYAETLALRNAVAVALARPDEPTAVLNVHRRSGKRPYAVAVMPLSERTSLELGRTSGAALVLVSDPTAETPDRRRLLRNLFGLSPREAQLAEALLAGKRLEHYAEEAGVSLNTAKSQLKSIFVKTDTARQAELIRVLNTLPAVRPQ